MSSTHEQLVKYYLNQVKTGRGGGMVFYRGSRMQRGHGLASFLGSIVKSPIVKKGLAYAAKTALNTGEDIVSNLVAGQDLKTAAKTGFNKQRDIQKRRAVNVIKSLVRPSPPPLPPVRRSPRAGKRVKRLRRQRKRSDSFGAL